jgi:hypothetical protein
MKLKNPFCPTFGEHTSCGRGKDTCNVGMEANGTDEFCIGTRDNVFVVFGEDFVSHLWVSGIKIGKEFVVNEVKRFLFARASHDCLI